MTQGHIRQRSPGSWELRYPVKGKVTTRTVQGSRKEAQRKLRELLDLADQGIAPAKGSCGEWFDTWLQAVRNEVSPLTHRLYRSQVERVFRPAFGSMKLAELDMFTIRAAWADLGDRLAPSSIRVAHRCLSACLSYAVEGRLIPHNPCANWRKGRGLPAMPDSEIAALTRVQVGRMLEAARGHALFAPVVIALGIGARRGEIAALRWSHVDLQTGEVRISEALREMAADDIRVGPPKSGKRRKVRLPTSYTALLREWRATQAEQMFLLGHRVAANDFVCTDAAGRPMTPNRITDQFKDLARRCGVSLTFHGLRHTHASLLLDAGESVKTVQLRLGHAKPSITLNIYSHAIGDDDAGEADRLDASLSSGRSSKSSSKPAG
jgi:integrase